MELDRAYVDRVYAGWLGKIMGVRHGAPVEGWSSADIERIFGDLSGFVLDVDIFEPDDDINGSLFFLRALEDEGAGENITPAQIARAWTNYPPYEHGFFWWPGYGRPTAYHMLEQGDAALSMPGAPTVGLWSRICGYLGPCRAGQSPACGLARAGGAAYRRNPGRRGGGCHRAAGLHDRRRLRRKNAHGCAPRSACDDQPLR